LKTEKHIFASSAVKPCSPGVSTSLINWTPAQGEVKACLWPSVVVRKIKINENMEFK